MGGCRIRQYYWRLLITATGCEMPFKNVYESMSMISKECFGGV